MLGTVNFSLKHASGSNGLLGAVDHFAELELLGGGVVGEHIFGWVASVCFVLGSVNEWMRRKGEDGRGGEGRGLCRVVCGRFGGFERVG